TGDGELVTFNGTLEVPRAALAGLDQPLGGAARARGLEEIADVSRALREVGGDRDQLSAAMQNRLALLQGHVPDLAVRPTTPPVRSTADPLLLPAGSSQPARVEAAAARAARLTRVVVGGVDAGAVTVLLGTLDALAARARAADSPGERNEVERLLTST